MNKLLYATPVETIWRAYQVSYGNHFREAQDEAKMSAFVCRWIRKGHISPLKHSLLQMACTTPIFTARQLAKHQVGMEWNEISRRYTEKNIEIATIDDGFIELNKLCLNAYYDAVDRGVPKERARAILPQATLTEWVWGGSLLAWANMVWQRESPSAQQEVRDFTTDFLTVVRSHNGYTYDIIRECADVMKIDTKPNGKGD